MELYKDWDKKGEMAVKSTRAGFGDALLELGYSNKNVVVLTADLSESTKVNQFSREFPSRFFQVGIAEQNMAGIATGLAESGKTPFMSSYACFSPGRNWDQIRVSICYQNSNVKIISSHSGLSTGKDGATHQALEDIAITRVLPNMTVIHPADYNQAYLATKYIADYAGPVYLRLSRPETPIYLDKQTNFNPYKADIIEEGSDITIVSNGLMLYKSLLAGKKLKESGISVEIINAHTIKPLDINTIHGSLKKTNHLVVVEEHQIAGGLGSAILEGLSMKWYGKYSLIGVNDSFGESGDMDELFNKNGLSVENIFNKCNIILNKFN